MSSITVFYRIEATLKNSMICARSRLTKLSYLITLLSNMITIFRKKDFYMLEKPQFKNIGNFDQTTGEIINDGVLALIPRKKINGFGEGWFAMNQSALKAFRESNLTGKDYDVLFAILEILDFDNYIQLCQQDISEKIKMKTSNVSRSVKKLIAIQALLEGPKISRSKTYRLNPNFGWKGSARSHHIALEQEKNSLAKRMQEKGFRVI